MALGMPVLPPTLAWSPPPVSTLLTSPFLATVSLPMARGRLRLRPTPLLLLPAVLLPPTPPLMLPLLLLPQCTPPLPWPPSLLPLWLTLLPLPSLLRLWLLLLPLLLFPLCTPLPPWLPWLLPLLLLLPPPLLLASPPMLDMPPMLASSPPPASTLPTSLFLAMVSSATAKGRPSLSTLESTEATDTTPFTLWLPPPSELSTPALSVSAPTSTVPRFPVKWPLLKVPSTIEIYEM